MDVYANLVRIYYVRRNSLPILRKISALAIMKCKFPCRCKIWKN